MATNTGNPQVPATDAAQAPKSRHQYGLPTPEGTPVPEDARIAADKERRAWKARQQGITPSITETSGDEEAPATQSKPAFDIGSQDDRESECDSDSDSDSDDSDDDGASPPSEAQIETVQYVLACPRKDHRKILKLGPVAEDARQEKENVVNSFNRLLSLIHPRFNKTEGAEKALKRLLNAGKKLGISKEEIKEAEYWNGEELAELHLTADGRWVNKADSMEGIENLSDLKPTEIHHQIWRDVTPLLGRLMQHPCDEEAVTKLKEANTKIVEENIANEFPDAMLNSYTIAIDTFKAIFMEAEPFLARLRKSHADAEARAKFDALNERLINFNRLHGYPIEWTMDLPVENAPGPAVQGNGQINSEAPSTSTQTVDKPGYRRCTRREGYVREDGIEKKIEGSLRVGFGHQMLISHPGKNNLTIFEKVAASKFGKGFGEAYNKRPDAKAITMGKAEELENAKLEEMMIGGVASDRRDPGKEPANGWAQQAKTIVRVGFGDNPKFTWYTRSTLGQRFGQAVVDEEISGYRTDAGQEAPLPLTRRASRPRKAPTTPKPLHSDRSPENLAEDSTATLLAKLKEFEGQIKQLSKKD